MDRSIRHLISAALAVPVLLVLPAWTSAASTAPVTATTRPLKHTLSQNRILPDLRVHDIPCSDVLEYLRDADRLVMYVDWNRLAPIGIDRTTPCTLDLRRPRASIALATLLRTVATPRGPLEWTTNDDGVTCISTPAGIEELLRRQDAVRRMKTDHPATARPIPRISFQAHRLTDAIEMLRKAADVKIEPEWKSLESGGIDREAIVTAELHDVSIAAIVDLMCAEVSTDRTVVEAHVEGDQLVISAAPRSAPTAPSTLPARPASQP